MFSLILTVIIDVMGSNLVLPLLPLLLIQSNSVLLPASFSESSRYVLYGLCMAAWPFGIFLGTPYLSGLSDTYGRKRILILALVGTVIAFILSALAVVIGSFVLFMLCRLLSGFFSGTFSIAQASVTHSSQSYQEKIRKLGWLSFAGTIGAIIGPLLSAYLVGSEHFPFAISLPFLMAALLGIINISLLYYGFNEPYQFVVFANFQLKQVVVQILTDFRFIFIDARTRHYAILFCLLQTGWGFYIQGLPLLLTETFHLHTHGISLFFMTLAASLGVAQITLRPILAKILKPIHMFIFANALLGLSALLLAFTKNLHVGYILACLSVVIEMIAYTGIISLFSDVVSPTEQGKVMGGTAAIFGLTWMLSGALTGQFAVIWLSLPIAFCSLFTLLAAFLGYTLNK
jgi:DHA1 family tetracycline resistance protein-like MFS transporter